jgi:acetyl-CoA acyltransferase 1
MNRLHNLASSLNSLPISSKHPDDVVICAALRTPVTRAKKGLLKDTAPEVMLSIVLKEVAARGKIQPKDVQDITVGCNLQPGAGQVNSRMGMLLADYP